MTDPDLTGQQRRLAITESVTEVHPDKAEQRIREFVERSAGSFNDWDHCFIELFRAPDTGRLFHASAGEGIEVYFSPSSGKGLWLMEQPSLRGKGFLAPQDVGRLANLASNVRPSAG